MVFRFWKSRNMGRVLKSISIRIHYSDTCDHWYATVPNGKSHGYQLTWYSNNRMSAIKYSSDLIFLIFQRLNSARSGLNQTNGCQDGLQNGIWTTLHCCQITCGWCSLSAPRTPCPRRSHEVLITLPSLEANNPPAVLSLRSIEVYT